MSEEIEIKIGETLKNRREEKKISIAEAQSATRISKKYLEALESENYKVLPTKVAVKGFLKNYAQYLGLDPKPLINEYDKLHKEIEEPPKVKPIETSHKKILLDKKELLLPAGRISYLLIALVIIAVVFVFSILISTWRHSEPVNEENIVSSSINTPTPEAYSGNITVESYEKKFEGLALSAEFNDRTWVEITIDDQTVFNNTFAKGDRQTWRAHEKIKIKTGNAGGMKLTLNGKQIGYLDKPGVVAEKEFTTR